jgi:4-carboxymuconolactone decarboxylase
MSRLSPLDETSLSAEQRALYESINSGPRARQGARRDKIGLTGPFSVWLHSPTIGNAAQSFGAVVRFGTTLPERIKEIAICTVGAHYQAKFEFAAHGPMAIAAGVPALAVEAIRVGRDPAFSDAADAASHRVALELLTKHRIDAETYAEALRHFGESGLVELVTIVGYYCLVSLTLNAFDVPLTERMTDPFPV